MVWVVFITILFMLPQVSPITVANFNYTRGRGPRRPRVRRHLVAGLGPNWFTGPKVQGTAEELAAIERELSA